MSKPFSSQLDSTVHKKSFLINNLINLFIFILYRVLGNTHSNILYYELVISLLLTYIVDIVFIQHTFKINNKHVVIPYNDWSFRLKYLLSINVFFKYLVVIGIGFIITKAVIEYINKMLKKYKLLQFTDTYKSFYKNAIMQFLVNMFINSLLLNFIKFNWAYIDSDDAYMSAIIITLFSLSILISVSK